MKKNTLVIFAGIMLLAGCSGSDDTAATTPATTQVDAGTKNDALMGYKRSLDTAKAIGAIAEESERKKNQAIQDLN